MRSFARAQRVRDVTAYAASLGTSLRAIGPMPREDVLRTLRGLDISDEDAQDVITYALANGFIVADGGALDAGPSES